MYRLLKAVPYDFRKKQSVSLDEEKQILARQMDISVCARDSCIAYIKPEIVWRTLMRSFGVTLPVLGSGLELSELIKI
jgi:hypothetical protein